MTYLKNISIRVRHEFSCVLQFKKDKLTVITGDEKTLKSKNFYEYDAFGGNSNIWGGYINFSTQKILKK